MSLVLGCVALLEFIAAPHEQGGLSRSGAQEQLSREPASAPLRLSEGCQRRRRRHSVVHPFAIYYSPFTPFTL